MSAVEQRSGDRLARNVLLAFCVGVLILAVVTTVFMVAGSTSRRLFALISWEAIALSCSAYILITLRKWRACHFEISRQWAPWLVLGIFVMVALVPLSKLSTDGVQNGQGSTQVGNLQDIDRHEQSGTPSKEIKSQADFEQSEFCRQYRCKEGDHGVLQDGAVNHIYRTSLNHVGVELQTKAISDPVVTGFDLMFYEREQLSDEDFQIINALVRSEDQTANHDKTIAFIRGNIERAVCSTCQVDQSAKSTRDGNFRIWAGKSGSEQIVSFKPVSSDQDAKYSGLEKLSDEDLLNRADSLLAGATTSQISQEHEGEAALYLSEFNRRHPNGDNKHAKRTWREAGVG